MSPLSMVCLAMALTCAATQTANMVHVPKWADWKPLDGNTVIASVPGTGSIDLFDVRTNVTVWSGQMQSPPGRFAFDSQSNQVWAALAPATMVGEAQLLRSKVSHQNVPGEPIDIAISEKYVIVLLRNMAVALLQRFTGKLVGVLRASSQPVGGQWYSRVWAINDTHMYLQNSNNGNLDFASWQDSNITVIQTISGGQQVGVAPNGARVVNYDTGVADHDAHDPSIVYGAFRLQDTTESIYGSSFTEDASMLSFMTGPFSAGILAVFNTSRHNLIFQASYSTGCQYGGPVQTHFSLDGSRVYGYSTCGFSSDSGAIIWADIPSNPSEAEAAVAQRPDHPRPTSPLRNANNPGASQSSPVSAIPTITCTQTPATGRLHRWGGMLSLKNRTLLAASQLTNDIRLIDGGKNASEVISAALLQSGANNIVRHEATGRVWASMTPATFVATAVIHENEPRTSTAMSLPVVDKALTLTISGDFVLVLLPGARVQVFDATNPSAAEPLVVQLKGKPSSSSAYTDIRSVSPSTWFLFTGRDVHSFHWDAKARSTTASFTQTTEGARSSNSLSFALSSDGKHVAAPGSSGITDFSASDLTEQLGGWLTSGAVAFSPDNKLLLANGQLWSVEYHTQAATLQYSSGCQYSNQGYLSYSSDGAAAAFYTRCGFGNDEGVLFFCDVGNVDPTMAK